MMVNAELVFVRLLVPLMIGIFCFSDVAQSHWYSILAGLATTILLALMVCSFHYKRFSRKQRFFMSGCFYLFCFMLGGWLSVARNEYTQPSHFSKVNSEYILVEINDEPQFKNNITRIRGRVHQSIRRSALKQVSGQVLISIQTDSNNQGVPSQKKFAYGDRILVPARYKEIAEPRNPYEFDVRNWYKRQNIFHQMFVQENEVLIQRRGFGNPVISWALKVRKKQVDLFRKLIGNDEANAVASTLILGYRADLSEETLMAYAKTGTIHALSVSGMHVGLIYVIINFLLSFLDRWPRARIFKLIIAVGLVWLYAVIAGLAPSVLRSAIMLTIYIIGSTFNRQHNAYNLLCFSAFMMLLFNPYSIYDVGFQLSYLSVFGLIFLQPLIYAWFDFKYYIADKLWNFFALSFAAQLSTFPLAIYYFHQFPVYFLLSNLFILLPVTGIMYIGLVILIFRLEILGPLFEWLINFINLGLKWIADLPSAALSGIWINQMELLLLSVALVSGCLALLHYKKNLLYLSITSICLLSFSFSYGYYQTQQQTRIIFYSLRNNGAIAFIHRDQAWLLTNLEEKSKALRSFVSPALEQSGVRQVTHLNIHQPFSCRYLQLREHQIVFSNFSLLLADTCFNKKNLSSKLSLNAINLSEHTSLDLNELLKHCETKQLIIDGSISSYRAERFKTVAENYDLPVYNLRIKKAYLVNLTK